MIRPVLALLLVTAAPAAANPKADVLAAVDGALTAISTGDAALFERVMLPDAIIVAQSYARGTGALTTRRPTVADLATRMRTTTDKVDERRTATTVLIQRDLAHVWADYTLDIDGKRRHCGVDSFGLVNFDGVWRINSLTWTAEPDGCAAVAPK